MPDRKSVRLASYDYTQSGAYFVTICVDQRTCLFGAIENDEMVLSDYGQIVVEEWLKTAVVRSKVVLGEYVVMPNHFHAIVYLTDDGAMGTAPGVAMGTDIKGTARRAPTEGFGAPVAGSLPTIIRAFKSAVSKRINVIRQSTEPPVWQRNYYEHIVRNEADYERIAEYIAYNPKRWAEDSLNPSTPSPVGARSAVPFSNDPSTVGARRAEPFSNDPSP